MPDPRRYATAGAFRRSLEDRLNQLSRNQGLDIGRLRRRIAFERLLARLFIVPNPRWMLKGGYAIELRLQNLARATKDIDLSISGGSEGRAINRSLRGWLQEELGNDLSDWFVFFLGEQTSDLTAAPLGGTRFHVEAQVDHRPFARFNLDVGIGDVVPSDPEWITGHELLSFAGIPPARIAVLPLDHQFAEKIHAYSLPRERVNTRVRDLVDLVLLIDHGLPPPEQINRALRATFDRRTTHAVPVVLPFPPQSWQEPYAALAAEHTVRVTTVDAAYKYISIYWSKLGLSVEQP